MSELTYEIESMDLGEPTNAFEKQFGKLNRRLEKMSTENEILKIRIQQFERITLRLAERADELQRSLEQLQSLPDVKPVRRIPYTTSHSR